MSRQPQYFLVFALGLCTLLLTGTGCLVEKKRERTIIKSTGSLEKASHAPLEEKGHRELARPLTEQDYLQGLENVVPALPLNDAETLKRIDEILQK